MNFGGQQVHVVTYFIVCVEKSWEQGIWIGWNWF